MKKIMWLIISLIALSCISVSAQEITEYKTEAFGMNYCYTEESVLANDYKVVKSVNIGDKIVCEATFETYAEDKIKSFKYTLVHGYGLKLIKENTNSLANKEENTYSYVLDEPTSVGEDVGSFTFEVVGTKDLQYGIKDIEFSTTENKSYYSADQINSIKFLWDDENVSFSKYKSSAFGMNYCYTEESVLANDYKVVKSVNIGDKIVCEATFETYAEDKIKSFKYTLVHGNGLKLIKENTNSLANKEENTYSYVLDEPTSVGEDIGSFTFEVVGTKDLQYGIKDIKFITSNKNTYYSDDIINTLKSDNVDNPKTGDSNIFLSVVASIILIVITIISYRKIKSKSN